MIHPEVLSVVRYQPFPVIPALDWFNGQVVALPLNIATNSHFSEPLTVISDRGNNNLLITFEETCNFEFKKVLHDKKIKRFERLNTIFPDDDT